MDLVPNRSFITAMVEAVAALTTWFDFAEAVPSVRLSKTAFTVGPDGVVGHTVADFEGYGNKDTGADPEISIDGLTGDILLTLPPPIGGWYWEATGDNNTPQTIYGVYLEISGTAWAGQLLPTPQPILGEFYSVSLDKLVFRLPVGCFGG